MANHRKAVNHLKRADPILASVIASVGVCRFAPRPEGTPFEALVRAIVYQQLSGKAAGTIHGRLVALFPGSVPEPVALLAISDERLRAAGLSRQKIAYLRDLATKVTTGALPLDHVDRVADDELIEYLVQVKGIGRWTAHMFLIFRLGRPNVLPDLDLGIQNAIKRAYRLRKHPAPARVKQIGAKWAPHATIAAWYLWRSLDSDGGAG
jgi:DNA-3-methyladenine glycosylase II